MQLELLTKVLGGSVCGWLVRLLELEGAGERRQAHTGSGDCAARMRWTESSFQRLFLVSSGAGERSDGTCALED